ncbi:MAG: D-alanine--D-alanine ligase family protein [Acidobacteriota bacterium]|jgi:D-alanine-D-alanine ligase
MARIGVIFGGRSVEHEVSVTSARTVAQGLEEAGHEVVPLGIGPDGVWVDRETAAAALAGELDRLPEGRGSAVSSLSHLVEAAADRGVEAVFPIVHGTWGEDGTLQGLCEMADLPYAGADVTASALAFDKVLTKRQLEAVGIPVVPYETVERRRFESDPDDFLRRLERFDPPLFVKPRAGGSSVGVRRAGAPEELDEAVRFALRFDDGVLVEQGVRGRELEVAVLGPRGELRASVVGEIVPGREFYDYEDKYLTDGAELIAPAELPDGLAERLGDLAVRAFGALGGHGMARVDFLLESEPAAGEDGVFVNEINTLPGFTSISMYPRLWGLSGIPLPELVDRLVRIAVDRHRERHRLDEGIRAWIAELAGRA